MRPYVQRIEALPDCSGAPAVVVSGRFTFAFDTLGRVTCNAIREVNATRGERERALDGARAAYLRARNAIVNAEWLRTNAELYADTQDRRTA